jgi:hypothetical protein
VCGRAGVRGAVWHAILVRVSLVVLDVRLWLLLRVSDEGQSESGIPSIPQTSDVDRVHMHVYVDVYSTLEVACVV